MLASRVSNRGRAALWLLLLMLASSGCARMTPGSGEAESEGDPVLACPQWEQRTARYTKKVICATPGGRICTPDTVVCLDIPRRALAQDTEITLTISGPEFAVEGKQQLNPGARLEPVGLAFRRPVTAVVRPRGTDDVANVSLLLASAPNQHEELRNVQRNSSTGQLTGELEHFSWLYPYLVGAAGPPAPPSLSFHGGPGTPSFGGVGSGGTSAVGLRVVVGPSGAFEWTGGTSIAPTLVLQVNFPAAAAGQTTFATLTMNDPGPYTGHGRNARHEWRRLVFDKIFAGMISTPGHPTGPDGIAVYPTRAVDINWAQLPAGYPSGQVTADLQFFNATGTLVATSTLVLSVARPNP
jgi:hypothetical protein